MSDIENIPPGPVPPEGNIVPQTGLPYGMPEEVKPEPPIDPDE